MNITKLLPFFIILIVIFYSCSNEQKNKSGISDNITDNNNHGDNNQVNLNLELNADFDISDNEPLVCGKSIDIDFRITDSTNIDSLVLYIENEKIISFDNNNFDYSYQIPNNSVGNKYVKITAYSENKTKDFQRKLLILSDIVPNNKSYEKIAEFPHDDNAYTQGLVFDNDVMYEATGLETKSSIRKVDLQTGDVLFSKSNPNSIFGEGITIFGNKLVQVTWRNHVGYVYNKNSFEQISEFNYNTEGWGLTNDDNFLYMSDGTHNIYELDPNSLSVVRIIQVADNERIVQYLNELEIIKGFLYANVYTKDYILKIDIKTGKVLEKINLAGILPNELIVDKTDVLNGIAYDKKNDRIFVTGKNWPKLYQVSF